MRLRIPDNESREGDTLVQGIPQREEQGGMADDTERVMGVLRRTLEAENSFRDIVAEASAANMQEASRQFAEVPARILGSIADPVEQVALIGQLDRNMAYHEDRLRLRNVQERHQEVGEMREQRLQGLMRDAAEQGGMAGAARSPQATQRFLGHLGNALRTVEQTVRATGRILGEDAEIEEAQVRDVRASMVGSFLAGMAQHDPEQAKRLHGQLSDQMTEAESGRASLAVEEGLRTRAVSQLELACRDGQTVRYDEALAVLHDRADQLGLGEEDRAVVAERLKMARARQDRAEVVRISEERGKVFAAFYGCTDSGDTVGACRLLDEDTVLSEAQRARMRSSLMESRWETAPGTFMETYRQLSDGELESGYDIIPGNGLSAGDAALLRALAESGGGKDALERQLVFRGVERALEGMGEAAEARRTDAIRTLLGSVADARARGEDVAGLLAPGREGSLVDVVAHAYAVPQREHVADAPDRASRTGLQGQIPAVGNHPF